MPFKFLTEFSKKLRDEFYSHVKPYALALAKRKERVTWDEYELFRGNSYERKLIHANLDDEAVLKLFEHYQKNSRRELTEFKLAEHYDDAIQREIAPLLAKRLREMIDREQRSINESVERGQ